VIPSPYFPLQKAGDGTLWVVDTGRHRFVNFTPDGRVIASWEKAGMAIDGFCGCCNPTHFALREAFTIPIPPTADAVDARPAVVSLILSAHSPHALCRPDCHGLCKTCGADLNETPDHVCAERRQDRRRLGDFLEP
jgi:hypothetical protein